MSVSHVCHLRCLAHSGVLFERVNCTPWVALEQPYSQGLVFLSPITLGDRTQREMALKWHLQLKHSD